MEIRIDNNNVIELQSLTNGITDVVDVAASVTVTIKDSAGVNVTGQSWPATMAHNTGGTYQAILDEALVLIPNRMYTAHVDAVGSGSEVGHWELSIKAITRTS